MCHSMQKILLPGTPGLEIRGCRQPRAPLNAPAASSNFCREPKYVLFKWLTEHFYEAYEDAIWLPGKNLNFEPWTLRMNGLIQGRVQMTPDPVWHKRRCLNRFLPKLPHFKPLILTAAKRCLTNLALLMFQGISYEKIWVFWRVVFKDLGGQMMLRRPFGHGLSRMAGCVWVY